MTKYRLRIVVEVLVLATVVVWVVAATIQKFF